VILPSVASSSYYCLNTALNAFELPCSSYLTVIKFTNMTLCNPESYKMPGRSARCQEFSATGKGPKPGFDVI
jgi:hypothetical protein